ncbi:hypothetical protein [Bradyrhizobium sp. SZCCHNR1047]|uniref:hypothetical protein n=1 Tax=Bradyrhizobium sp. SZCCHNR1047 TaxID=3057354 RepID=UPI0029168082|nr:hypothetical protein [Bradyrhizobium sp. SZCCHNR1047]
MPTTSAIVTATAIQVARLEKAVSPEAGRSCGAAGDGAAADPFRDPFVPAFGRLRVNAFTSRPNWSACDQAAPSVISANAGMFAKVA